MDALFDFFRVVLEQPLPHGSPRSSLLAGAEVEGLSPGANVKAESIRHCYRNGTVDSESYGTCSSNTSITRDPKKRTRNARERMTSTSTRLLKTNGVENISGTTGTFKDEEGIYGCRNRRNTRCSTPAVQALNHGALQGTAILQFLVNKQAVTTTKSENAVTSPSGQGAPPLASKHRRPRHCVAHALRLVNLRPSRNASLEYKALISCTGGALMTCTGGRHTL